MKALYQVGCLPQVVSKVIASYAHASTIRPLVRLTENDGALFLQRLGLGHDGLLGLILIRRMCRRDDSSKAARCRRLRFRGRMLDGVNIELQNTVNLVLPARSSCLEPC